MKKLFLFVVLLFAVHTASFASFPDGPYTANTQWNTLPWSGYWWPMQYSADLNNLYDEKVEGNDGPLKKYDDFMGLLPPSNTKTWEGNDCNDHPKCTTGHKYNGSASGHCGAWSVASIMEEEPKYGTSVGVLPSSDGSVHFLSFRVGDLKGLLVEEYMGNYTTPVKPPKDYEYNGSPALTPRQFLNILRTFIKGDKGDEEIAINPGGVNAPIIFNLNDNINDVDQVWNYPVYQYTLKKCETISGDLYHCTVEIFHAGNELPSYDYVGTYPVPATYTFNILLDSKLKPKSDGAWKMSGLAPAYAKTSPMDLVPEKASSNHFLDYKKVKQLIHAAPFVMRVQISQSGNVKYDAYWEWNAGSQDRGRDTDGDGKKEPFVVKDKPVVPAAGEVSIKLVFSRTMDIDTPPKVYYEAPDGSRVDGVFYSREATNFTNDTLIYKAEVPCVSGDAVLAVGGKGIQNRDIDGDPSTFAQKWEDEHAPWDLNHRFRISQPATPQVVATVPEAEPWQLNHWEAKEPVEVTSLVKIIFSEKMFERVGDAKYTALLSSLKIQESGKIKVAGLSEEQINEWCAGTIKDGWCAGMINLAKLAPDAVWKARSA